MESESSPKSKGWLTGVARVESAWRPGHIATCQDMDMKMEHGLVGPLPRVDDDAESVLRDAQLLGDMACREQKVTKTLLVFQ